MPQAQDPTTEETEYDRDYANDVSPQILADLATAAMMLGATWQKDHPDGDLRASSAEIASELLGPLTRKAYFKLRVAFGLQNGLETCLVLRAAADDDQVPTEQYAWADHAVVRRYLQFKHAQKMLPIALLLGVDPMQIGEVEVVGGVSGERVSTILGALLGTSPCPDCGEVHALV